VPIAEFVREQPEVLRRVAAEVPAQVARLRVALPSSPQAVALVGSGTSRHALLGVESVLGRRLGCPARVVSPIAFIADDTRADGALAVILSQSGASATTIAAVPAARARGMATLVLTAEAASPIARAGGPCVVMPIGPEPVGPKTKGYTGSVLALLCVAAVLGGEPDVAALVREAHAVADGIAASLDHWGGATTALARRHAHAPYVMLLATGRHHATVEEAALKITEMAGMPAAAFHTEEALHGRFHALTAETPVFLVATAGRDLELARHTATVLTKVGVPAHVLAIGEANALAIEVPPLTAVPELDLLAAIVPLQQVALALAHARGVAPEHMRYPRLSEMLGIKL
jgi:glucoselysine-6-phosphate deglycase